MRISEEISQDVWKIYNMINQYIFMYIELTIYIHPYVCMTMDIKQEAISQTIFLSQFKFDGNSISYLNSNEFTAMKFCTWYNSCAILMIWQPGTNLQ